MKNEATDQTVGGTSPRGPLAPGEPTPAGQTEVSQSGLRLGWRWIPDPADEECMSILDDDRSTPSDALLNALAWATMHHWG